MLSVLVESGYQHWLVITSEPDIVYLVLTELIHLFWIDFEEKDSISISDIKRRISEIVLI